MPIPRKPIPSVGEYVVATVKEIFEYGAYVELDEYNNMRAYLPWSEIATKWIRNIRDVIRENQKIVVRVIRVDKTRGAVDVSLKKVPDNEKRRKMQQWKRYLRACKLVEFVANAIGKSIEDAYREVIWKLEDHYGDPLLGLEEAVMRGESALREAGVPEEWIKPLIEEAKHRIQIKTVRIRAMLFIRSNSGDGIVRIKKALSSINEIASNYKDVKANVYVYGTPRYMLELHGSDYKVLEKVLNDVISTLQRHASELGLEFKYERVE